MQRKRAFTLIELLVVIAIIAILAAILFPVFAKARERAKQSKSLNNLKQLAIGVMSYSQDYGETFPGWQMNPDGRFAHNVWDEQINASIKSKDVFNNGDTGFASPSDPQKARVLTYAMNGYLLCTPSNINGTVRGQMTTNENPAQPPAPLSTSTVSDPADTILFAEIATEAAVSAQFQQANWPVMTNMVPNGTEQWNAALPGGQRHWIDISPREWVETSTGNGSKDSYDEAKWDPTRGVARDMYSGGGNYAFVDGHVQFQKIGKTIGLGQVVNVGSSQVTIVPGATAWNANNTRNQWYPSR